MTYEELQKRAYWQRVGCEKNEAGVSFVIYQMFIDDEPVNNIKRCFGTIPVKDADK